MNDSPPRARAAEIARGARCRSAGAGAPLRPILVFDGDCGLCTAFVQRCANLPVDFERVNAHALDTPTRAALARYGISTVDLDREVVLVVGAALYRGHEAVNALLILGGGWYRIAGRVLAAPIIRAAEGMIYRCVARHRRSISALLGLRSCALPRP
jgi:predicted DCC family thiol-disulfide oxidoreductase YuxK